VSAPVLRVVSHAAAEGEFQPQGKFSFGAGDLFGMLFELGECGNVRAQAIAVGVERPQIAGEELLVFLHLFANIFACFADDVAMVEGLNARLECKGNEQPDGNGSDMREKITPAVHGFMGSVDIEHRGLLEEERVARYVKKCGTKELRLSVIGPADSRMPRPQHS
jgi:hypothetical protein